MQVKAGAALTADARRREPAAGLLHQLSAAGHIAAGGRDRAAQVLDQGTRHQVGAHRRGLLQLHQFAVAVVDKHQAAGLNRLHLLHQSTDLLHRERRAPAVAAAALNQHHACGQRQRLGDAGFVDRAIGQQIELVVGDAEFGQGSLALAADANHLLEGVVGAARERQQAIAGAQHAIQRGGNGMGATHKLQPHGGGFGLQHPGEDPIQHLPAQIAMAVATHRGEVVHPQALGPKGLQHPLQPRLHTGAALLSHRRGALQGRSQLIGHPGLMGCAHGEQQHNPMLQAACRSIIRLDFFGLVCWLQRLAAGNHPRPVVRWSPRDPQANRSLRIL